MDTDRLKGTMSVIGYSDEDLRANRTGILSEGQKRRIQNNARASLIVFTVVGVCFALLFCFTAEQPINRGSIIVAGLSGGAFSVIGVALFWIQRRDYRKGIVKSLTGRIEVNPIKHGFALRVGDEQLPIFYDLRGLIDEHAIYKVYYTPSDRRIVSLEQA